MSNRSLDIKITKVKVTAKTRKLRANWTFEPDKPDITTTGWKERFAWLPVDTLGGEHIWWQKVYKRVLRTPYDEYKVNGKDYSKITQYATDFDVLSGKYEDLGSYFPEDGLSAMHGLDLEKEITDAMSKSIADEIDKEIMSDLVKTARK